MHEADETTATRLDRIELEDGISGSPVRLGTLWRDRSAVLLFVRHFG